MIKPFFWSCSEFNTSLSGIGLATSSRFVSLKSKSVNPSLPVCDIKDLTSGEVIITSSFLISFMSLSYCSLLVVLAYDILV